MNIKNISSKGVKTTKSFSFNFFAEKPITKFCTKKRIKIKIITKIQLKRNTNRMVLSK